MCAPTKLKLSGRSKNARSRKPDESRPNFKKGIELSKKGIT